jgi:predicted nucleic acid-binding protein
VTRILVEFKAEDEGAAEILEALNQFDPYTVERAEMEAHLFMVLARVSWRDADRYRQIERRLANQGKRRKKS